MPKKEDEPYFTSIFTVAWMINLFLIYIYYKFAYFDFFLINLCQY